MRGMAYAGLLIGTLFTFGAAGQSLEQSYADLCSGGQRTEACDVLRRAMLDRLQTATEKTEPDAAPPALVGDSDEGTVNPSSQRPVQELVDRARWGFLLDVVDSAWIDAKGENVQVVRWEVPGHRLLMTAIEVHTGRRLDSLFVPDPDVPDTLNYLAGTGDGGFRPLATLKILPDGAGVWNHTGTVAIWRLVDPETWGFFKGKLLKEGAYQKRSPWFVWRRLTEPELQRLLADARQPGPRSKDRSGLIGALVGAAVGAYAGTAAGLDSASTAALMMQGASATGAGGAVADGFARGLAEESAKQEAMQRGLEDARMSGMAQGAAEYAARQEAQARQLAQQRQADADHAQRVREQEQAAREARLAAQQQAGRASAGQPLPQGGSGPALEITSSERAPPADAAPVATRAASRYAWCMARQEYHEGERGKPVLYLSEVAEVDAAQASQTARMAVNFRAALPASNRIAPPICDTDHDRARADAMLRNLPDRYPGWEVVRTGVAPLL